MAELDELISKEALLNWDKFCASLDKSVASLDKVILGANNLDKTLAKVGTSSKNASQSIEETNKATKGKEGGLDSSMGANKWPSI